jgi:hypothetical protein
MSARPGLCGEHVRNDAGSVLIAAGFAEQVVYNTRQEFIQSLPGIGTPAPVQPGVEPPVAGIRWVFSQTLRGKNVLLRKCGSETIFCSTLQNAADAGAPKELLERFAELLSAPERELQEIERVREEVARQPAQPSADNWLARFGVRV